MNKIFEFKGITINTENWTTVRVAKENAKEVIDFLKELKIVPFRINVENQFIFDAKTNSFTKMIIDDFITIRAGMTGMSMHRIIEKVKQDRES